MSATSNLLDDMTADRNAAQRAYEEACDMLHRAEDERDAALARATEAERRAEEAGRHIAALERNEREVWVPAAEARDRLSAALAAARAEVGRLKSERATAARAWLVGAPHANALDDCPTFYDGCHCTVDTLAHNLARAEQAEAQVSTLTASLEQANRRVDDLVEASRSEVLRLTEALAERTIERDAVEAALSVAVPRQARAEADAERLRGALDRARGALRDIEEGARLAKEQGADQVQLGIYDFAANLLSIALASPSGAAEAPATFVSGIYTALCARCGKPFGSHSRRPEPPALCPPTDKENDRHD